MFIYRWLGARLSCWGKAYEYTYIYMSMFIYQATTTLEIKPSKGGKAYLSHIDFFTWSTLYFFTVHCTACIYFLQSKEPCVTCWGRGGSILWLWSFKNITAPIQIFINVSGYNLCSILIHASHSCAFLGFHSASGLFFVSPVVGSFMFHPSLPC